MRASRLMSIVLLLQNRGRLTARELAKELEVSVRTVYRDVEALSASGVPVYGEGGRDGGYQLLDGYRTRLTGLTSCEAESLFLAPDSGPAGPAGPVAELGLGSYLASARLKLAAALPATVGEHAARIGSRFLLDTSSWRRDAPGSAHLPALTQAIKDDQAVRVRQGGHEAEAGDGRPLSPLGLVLEAGAWYLVAHDGEAVTSRPVAGIHTVEQAGGPFHHVSGFQLRLWWEQRSGSTTPSPSDGPEWARIRLTGPGPELLRADAELAAILTSMDDPDSDGHVMAGLRHDDRLAARLLSLGPHVEVLAPPELRAAVADAAEAVSGLYRSGL
ncbi:helix-turn-helix transcriptional regulator [Streptomyces sp. NPDC002671]